MHLFTRKFSLIVITIFLAQLIFSCSTNKFQSVKYNYTSAELTIAQVNKPNTDKTEALNKLDELEAFEGEKAVVSASAKSENAIIITKRSSSERLFTENKKSQPGLQISHNKVKKNYSVESSKSPNQDKPKGKNQWIALVLVLLLGAYGAHRFYLGHTKSAILQLMLIVLALIAFVAAILLIPLFATPTVFLVLYAIGFLLTIINSVWVIVDIVNILTGNLKPKNGEYAETIEF